MKKFLIVLLLLCFVAASAHQPRITYGIEITQQKPVVIYNPEVSQAFYGELAGHEDYYQITSEKPFNLYVGLLSPDIQGADKDFSAVVYKDGEQFAKLDGLNFTWTNFHEEFANDNYWQGPEFEKNSSDMGTYTIKVYSPDNAGKYVLVVGKLEKFPLNEVLKTMVTLPKLKAQFFGKPAYTGYTNMIGIFFFGPIILIFAVILISYLIIRRIKSAR